jgi:disulfide bond formation protein DsbB
VGLVATCYARWAPKLAAVLLVALCLALLYNAGLGIYHAGAEWHFWAGPDTCSGDTLRVTSLSKSLRLNQAVRCDEAALRIFGLSLAGYSVLISGGLATIGFRALLRDKSWRS